MLKLDKEYMNIHTAIWNVIDNIAKNNNLSSYKFSLSCGLDATSLLPNKRYNKFPNVYTICKILKNFNLSFEEFGKLLDMEIKNVEENKQ